MQVWEQALDDVNALHFSASDIGKESLGSIVENNLIRACLKQSIEQHQGPATIHWYVPQRLASISVTESKATVTLKSGDTLTAALAIAADGANSVTRRKLALPEVSRSYAQYGVVAELETALPHEHTAYQRFHEAEVMGMLPLANGHCSMVWSCSQNKSETLINLSAHDLALQVQEFCQEVLGDIKLVGEAKAFPLQLLHSRQYVAERVVLCGDAAHAVHPLAGQGVNLGLLDAHVLSEVLSNAWEKNLDLGDLSVLRAYERKRKGNNVQMMSVLDTLFGLFQSSNPVLQQARRMGMGMLNRMGPLKKFLIEQALGVKSLE
jgi:2-octaprenylphenol hydroxylase